MSAIFYQVFIFSPNVFYFIETAPFILGIFKFLYFLLFLSTLSKFKRTNDSGIWCHNWLAKICRHNFWNNWKAALYYLIKLGQVFWLYSFKIYYFQKNFLWVIYKIKRGPGTSFWCTFCAWFFHKKVPYLIHLSMDKLSISYLFSLSNYQTK